MTLCQTKLILLNDKPRLSLSDQFHFHWLIRLFSLSFIPGFIHFFFSVNPLFDSIDISWVYHTHPHTESLYKDFMSCAPAVVDINIVWIWSYRRSQHLSQLAPPSLSLFLYISSPSLVSFSLSTSLISFSGLIWPKPLRWAIKQAGERALLTAREIQVRLSCIYS